MNVKKYQKKFQQSLQLKTDPNGKYLARNDGTAVYLYDPVDYKEITSFCDMDYVNQIKFSADGQLLVLKSIEPQLAVYDLNAMKIICRVDFDNTEQAQDGKFCLSPDNRYIYNIVYFNDSSSAIARVDIKRQQYQIIFQFENCLFEEAEYLDWRHTYMFCGNDLAAKKYFILEYGEENDRFRRISLERKYNLFQAHSAAQAFIAAFGNKIYILAADYSTPLQIFAPVDDATTKLNFFKIISESPTLHKIFDADHEEYSRLKTDSEQALLDVPVEGDIIAVCLSKNMKYLLVATSNVIKIFDYKKMKLLNQIKLINIADLNFGYDDSKVLVGTWNFGYIYNLHDLIN